MCFGSTIKKLAFLSSLYVVFISSVEAQGVTGKVVPLFGVKAAERTDYKINTLYVLHLATFKKSSNAMRYVHRLESIVPKQLIHVRPNQDDYSLLIGPTDNISLLRQLAAKLAVDNGSIAKKNLVLAPRRAKPVQAAPAHLPVISPFDLSALAAAPTTTSRDLFAGSSSGADSKLRGQAAERRLVGLAVKADLSTKNHVFNGWNLSLGVGPSWYRSNNPFMDVTTTDTNLDVTSGVNTTALYRAGIGYELVNKKYFDRNYLNQLFLELNYYYVNSTIAGHVWDYSSANSDNYTFNAPFNSSRLMLDLKPVLLTKQDITSYLIVGGGAAWNRISYTETAVSAEYQIAAIALPSYTNQTLAYDLGVGLKKEVLPHLDMSVEYLYTSLGSFSPSVNATSLQTIVSPPAFSLTSNSLMFNLAWKYS